MTHRSSPWTFERLLPLELCIYAVASLGCLAACVAEVPTILAKTRAVQFFFQLRPVQSEWVERVAVEGELPTSGESTIGMRPAQPAHDRTGNLLWRCGTRPAPTGWTAPPAPAAAASAGASFSVCRKGRDE